MGIPVTKGPHHHHHQQQKQQQGPEATRVSEALGGESTQQVGSDATNMASPADSVPAVALETEEEAAVGAVGEPSLHPACKPASPQPASGTASAPAQAAEPARARRLLAVQGCRRCPRAARHLQD